MFLLKACPKCHGDQLSERDDLHCFQCGFIIYATPPLPYVSARRIDRLGRSRTTAGRKT